MKTSNITKYKDLLNRFAFEKLENELLSKPFEDMEYYLNQMAYDTKSGESNLLVYTFLLMMIVENETPTMHLLVSRLMGTVLNFIKDAEKIGLYHGMRATELDPENIDILEYLLYFHHIPERLLDDSTAILFAEKVLEKYPDSLAAKMTLAKAQG